MTFEDLLINKIPFAVITGEVWIISGELYLIVDYSNRDYLNYDGLYTSAENHRKYVVKTLDKREADEFRELLATHEIKIAGDFSDFKDKNKGKAFVPAKYKGINQYNL